ncbi:MAG TPA: choice-of-anchor D domain-containing protein [Burkholderiaceae bacterium]|jgi:hypothetical protein|nr:choice-of-anchor D domain-containing protein [Burkholderiaceae bacterium]
MSARLIRTAAALCVAALGSMSALAQTAADGYSIYQNAIYKGQNLGVPACATCHGPDPHNSVIPQILMAAGNPAFLLTAWALAPMSQFNYATLIDANGREGIATYLLYPDAGTKAFSLFAAQSLDFGTLVIGQSMTKTMTLTNIGAQALTNVVIQANPSATGVTETDNCPGTLAIQASCTVSVRFSPLAAGTANAAYVVSASNDANTSGEFFVFATGATSTPPPMQSSGGGGAFGWISLAGLLVALWFSRRRAHG